MIETSRLILRGWHKSDRPIFHGYCIDPEVMRYLGPPPTRSECDAGIDRQNALLARLG